jgi:hypothetical protein
MIEAQTFHGSLWGSISIPKCVLSLESNCLSSCGSMRVLVIESGAQLSDIGDDIVGTNSWMEWIKTPASILAVCRQGFRHELRQGIVAITK